MSLRTISSCGAVIAALSGSAIASAATIAQWDFNSLDVATSKIVTDISGHNHNASYIGAMALSPTDPYDPTGAESVDNSLITVPNVNGFGQAANPGTINLTTNNAFTLEGWINPSAYVKSTLIGLNGTNFTALLGMDANGHVYTQFYDQISPASLDVRLTGTTKIPLNTWTHIAYTYDGTTLKGYVNGVQDSSQAVTGPLPTSLTQVGLSGAFSLGYWTGKMDDVRISNVALLPSEFLVPEPASMSALALGGLMLIRRRRRS